MTHEEKLHQAIAMALHGASKTTRCGGDVRFKASVLQSHLISSLGWLNDILADETADDYHEATDETRADSTSDDDESSTKRLFREHLKLAR